MNEDKLKKLEQTIGYQFHNIDLLYQAVTHTSYANEHRYEGVKHNERMEFLGDAVLELVVSQFLYKEYPEKNEGELTKLRASLVCEHTLAICATEISLGECINLSKGEDRTGGRQRPSILSDAFESVIGAIYLDGGFEYAKQFIEKILLKDIEHKQLFYDAKTILQEIVQGEENESLTYELVAESGPDHCKEFTVVAKINDKIIGNGNGKTKKAAEQMAAYHAILELKNVSSK